MNSDLFGSTTKAQPTAGNEAGGRAFALSPKEIVAQFCATCTFGDTYYVDASTQLEQVIEAAKQCDTEFLLKAALYSRDRANLKDMPAVLLAIVAGRGGHALFPSVFRRVINNARMLRNFAQAIRSGKFGRRSFGSMPKRLMREWITSRTPASLFHASIGDKPSLADVIKMVHPKPLCKQQADTIGYLIESKPYSQELDLPDIVHQFEAWKGGIGDQVPDVNFQMLTGGMELSQEMWAKIMCDSTLQTLRMNLNTFARHGVFSSPAMIETAVRKLTDLHAIKEARIQPYQCIATYSAFEGPMPIKKAIGQMTDIALNNVEINWRGRCAVAVDVSGSMACCPATGKRKHHAGRDVKAPMCGEVASLFAAAVLHKRPDIQVIPFDTQCHSEFAWMRMSVLDTAATLAKFGGGGTDCSAPLRKLLSQREVPDLIVVISDNQSWHDWVRGGAGMMDVWMKILGRNPQARLVCIDIQPYAHTQACEKLPGVYRVGGLNDSVFDYLNAISEGRRWVDEIDRLSLS